MLLSKILGGVSVILLLSCAGLLFVNQSLELKIEKLKAENVNIEIQLNAFKESHETQKQTIATLEKSSKDTDKELNTLMESVNTAQRETQNVQIQMDKLRYTEAQLAIQKPFIRGNASDTRKRNMLLRFTGEKSTD